MKLVLLISFLLLLSLHLVHSKKMWGSRRKREEADEIVASPDTAMKRNGKSSRRGGAKNSRMPSSFDSSQLEETLNLYLNSFEEVMNSDDFDAMVNPNSIRNMMMQFPGAADVPELQSLFSMAEFSDPELLKATMREGLTLAKRSSREIIELLSDPEKMEELVGQFPPEVKALIEALRTGDFTALKDFVINLPGMRTCYYLCKYILCCRNVHTYDSTYYLIYYEFYV